MESFAKLVQKLPNKFYTKDISKRADIEYWRCNVDKYYALFQLINKIYFQPICHTGMSYS